MGKFGVLARGVILALAAVSVQCVHGDESPKAEQSVAAVEPFTGKISKNRVRMRLEPSLFGTILDELDEGTMVVVTGQDEDFYAIKPPQGSRAFVFRTYILDGVIEGNHINVRLEPHLDAPVIAQLNTGDRVNGEISALNSKWFEIDLPEAVRFYVAHNFVERLGDPEMMTRLERRRQEANHLVNAAYIASQEELQKDFHAIDLEGVTADFHTVIESYGDVEEEQERARYFLTIANDRYLRRKIDHLEIQAKEASERWQGRCQELAKQMQDHEDHLSVIEQDLREKGPDLVEEEETSGLPSEDDEDLVAFGAPVPVQAVISDSEPPVAQKSPQRVTQAMLSWIPSEATAFERWALKHPGAGMDAFYAEQMQMSMQLKGALQPYPRPIKNKPGNFVLLDVDEHLPMAFLYSTRVNLEEFVGTDATLRVAPRPSNHFAFPAYFVLEVSVEDGDATF